MPFSARAETTSLANIFRFPFRTARTADDLLGAFAEPLLLTVAASFAWLSLAAAFASAFSLLELLRLHLAKDGVDMIFRDFNASFGKHDDDF